MIFLQKTKSLVLWKSPKQSKIKMILPIFNLKYDKNDLSQQKHIIAYDQIINYIKNSENREIYWKLKHIIVLLLIKVYFLKITPNTKTANIMSQLNKRMERHLMSCCLPSLLMHQLFVPFMLKKLI